MKVYIFKTFVLLTFAFAFDFIITDYSYLVKISNFSIIFYVLHTS